jgi:hypothetical protein
MGQTRVMASQNHDDSRVTRWWCVLGLIISWFVGIGAFVAGGICVYLEARDGNAAHVHIVHTAREVLPLGLNVLGMSFYLPR